MPKKKRLIVLIIEKKDLEQQEAAQARAAAVVSKLEEMSGATRRSRLSPLEFQNEINDELWLSDEGC